MTSTQQSPLHVTAINREPAFSLMSRMASVGGTSAADFGLDIEVPFQDVLDGDPKAINRLADIAGLDVQPLQSWTPSKSDRARRLIRNEKFPSKTVLISQIRGCPLCLQEDANCATSLPQRAMAVRGDWLLPHVTVCIRHEHSLVPLWKESHPFSRYDTVPQLAKITPQILAGNYIGSYRDPTDFDEWLDMRLTNGAGDNWLDQFDANAAANFCRLLGSALMRCEGIPLKAVSSESKWAFSQMGFEVASEGEEAIHEALCALNRLAEPKEGPKAVFPLLYDRLSREYRDVPEYRSFRDILGSHLRKTWPLGPGDDLVGEPVVERQLHSVRTAAQETGIDARRLRKMLEAAGLIDDQLPDAWAVFNASDAHELLSSLVEFITAKDFAESINMTRSQFDLLVEDGILRPSLRDAGTKHVWDRSDGQVFVDSVLIGAEMLHQAQHGWEHISKSAQRLKIRPADIIRAIKDGHIQRVGKNVQFTGYRSIHVYHAEVAMVLGGQELAAISLEVFSKSVGLGRPVHMNRLILNGHTSATKIRNPKTKALQRYITKKDAEAFHTKFVTLRTIAKSKEMSWQKASGQLKAKGVAPFSSDGADYGNLYLKSEADAALA
jgi:hypothetical protein